MLPGDAPGELDWEMRTTLNVDADLLNAVVRATGETTKSRAVNVALKEYIRRKHVEEWIDSWGKIIVDDYSDEDMRLDEERRVFLDSVGKDDAS